MILIININIFGPLCELNWACCYYFIDIFFAQFLNFFIYLRLRNKATIILCLLGHADFVFHWINKSFYRILKFKVIISLENGMMAASINRIDENFLRIWVVHMRNESRTEISVFLGQFHVDSGQFWLMAISRRNREKCRLNEGGIPFPLDAM